MEPYGASTLEHQATAWTHLQSALLDGRSVPTGRSLVPTRTAKEHRLRQRLEDDATHHALANTPLWEAWQDFIRHTFTGRLLGFTATTADDYISLTRFTRTIHGLSEIGLPGIAFVEGEEYGTLGDEKRLHAHGIISLSQTPPELSPMLQKTADTILRSIGHAKVEEIRDRVLWARYITKDVTRDMDGNRVITW